MFLKQKKVILVLWDWKSRVEVVDFEEGVIQKISAPTDAEAIV